MHVSLVRLSKHLHLFCTQHVAWHHKHCMIWLKKVLHSLQLVCALTKRMIKATQLSAAVSVSNNMMAIPAEWLRLVVYAAGPLQFLSLYQLFNMNILSMSFLCATLDSKKPK